MSTLAIAPTLANRSQRWIVHIPAPAAMARELATRAAGRFEEALAFRDRIAECERLGSGPFWPKLAIQARRDLDQCEEALAWAIEGLYDLFTPAGAQVAQVEGLALWGEGDGQFVSRGIRVGDRAYLLEAAAGDMRPKIVRRIASCSSSA